MSNKVGVEAIINRYCERFPSGASRAAISSELRQAHGYRNLLHWNEQVFFARLRALECDYKPQSIILKFQRLHRFFDWAKGERLIRANPIVLGSLPKFRNLKAPTALTHKEVKKLYSQIPGRSWIGLRDRLAISLMLVHGYRISSITGLNWQDFVHHGGHLHVASFAKNGVVQNRRVRSDVQRVFQKLADRTLEERC